MREAVLRAFAYVSPAATVHYASRMRTQPAPRAHKAWDRLVDGGYFENSGVATLSDVIRAYAVARACGAQKAAAPRKIQFRHRDRQQQ